MVQGRSSFDTSIAMIPYQIAVFTAAILGVSIYDRLTPRQIASYAFAVVSAALLLQAFMINNAWSNLLVIAGLVMFGLGQGALVTLLFDVLVTASPKELAGDVGSLRGTINNLSAALGTALAGALVVSILSANIMSSLVDNPAIPPELKSQVNLDNATFVSNDRLLTIMQNTTASPEQINEALRINAAARLRALKRSLLILACLGLMVIIPTRRLPNYRPGEIPAGPEGPPSTKQQPSAIARIDEMAAKIYLCQVSHKAL
jgi:MFS family permease